MLTINGLVAAREVLIPVQAEYYALEGLAQLLDTVGLVQEHLNPELRILGVLVTMYDGRTRLGREVAGEVREHLGAARLRHRRPAQRAPQRGPESRPPDLAL